MTIKIVRRVHLYLALFLSPWLLMYALSTIAMNHRETLLAMAGGKAAAFAPEREIPFAASFPSGANPAQKARQILTALDLEGAHTVVRRSDDTLVITRNDLTSPRRITYSPSSSTVAIERMEPRTSAFLERFHRRRGYATGYGVDTAWAVTVDLVIVALIVWVLSGLWMWWEIKATRIAGAVAGVIGLGLFVLFLVRI